MVAMNQVPSETHINGIHVLPVNLSQIKFPPEKSRLKNFIPVKEFFARQLPSFGNKLCDFVVRVNVVTKKCRGFVWRVYELLNL